MVALALLCSATWLVQNGRDLFDVKVFGLGAPSLLGRDAQYSSTLQRCQRLPICNEAVEGADRGKTAVARPDRCMPLGLDDGNRCEAAVRSLPVTGRSWSDCMPPFGLCRHSTAVAKRGR